MIHLNLEQLLPKLEQAQHLSAEAFRFLKQIDIKALDSDDDDSGHFGRALQLILQYRLDTQDILVRLLHVERMVLSWLGIEPMAGSSINLDRIRYALGKEDLNSLLYNLSQLIDSLLKVTESHQRHLDFYQSHQKSLSRHSGKLPKYLSDLGHAQIKQEKAFKQLKSIENELQYLEKYEAQGPVLDHVSALEGPINKFYQATLHGLEYTLSLYHLFEKKSNLTANLAQLMNRAERVLHQLEHSEQLQPTPPKETLEERARKKRLGHFFRGS